MEGERMSSVISEVIDFELGKYYHSSDNHVCFKVVDVNGSVITITSYMYIGHWVADKVYTVFPKYEGDSDTLYQVAKIVDCDLGFTKVTRVSSKYPHDLSEPGESDFKVGGVYRELKDDRVAIQVVSKDEGVLARVLYFQGGKWGSVKVNKGLIDSGNSNDLTIYFYPRLNLSGFHYANYSLFNWDFSSMTEIIIND